ncbi:FkbM family methyltransferase [Nitrospira moscoviensis]|uniref:Putative SAM-dependent methyltransferase n=1 Tax=Nitrospira moscoviensis TaxID=42253 RepID=A0A0K2GH06_NITMO|nr:FkbM family methyltransferase [Nitrospira moscoviensis]ALA59892.1 putative SAM-dependent methyltransferase [Nitrospira moscoviensis]
METRLKRLGLAIKTTRNWPCAISVWLGLTRECTAKFRGGHTLKFNKSTWGEYLRCVYLFHHFPSAKLAGTIISFTYKNRNLSFNFGSYGFDTILEIFGGEPYREFFESTPIKGRQVVDIGAAFGDTAISFLLEGASQVYAIEAFPGYFRLAEENVQRNGFSKVCTVILAAAGGSPGTLSIDHNLEDMFGAGVQPSEVGAEVPIVTLEQVVNRFGINNGILKLDVEGYEYEILLNAEKKVLQRFSYMVIEYHYGFERLKAHLEDAGFVVHHTAPHWVYMPYLKDEPSRNMQVGNIYAKLVA